MGEWNQEVTGSKPVVAMHECPSGEGGSLKVYREGELLDSVSAWVRSPLRAVFTSLDDLFVSNGVTACNWGLKSIH